MLQAILKGKLSREEERMEDLLTSCVFGILKHIHPDQILIPFLRLARNPLSEAPLNSIFRKDSTVEAVNFWPHFKGEGCHSCEPDVDITIRNGDGSRARLFIEAKFLSGKSSLPDPMSEKPYDQLAREYDNLHKLACNLGISDIAVIYLTADYGCPAKDLKETINEYKAKRKRTPHIYWLSWRKLPEVLKGTVVQSIGLLDDLSQLLEHLNLTPFNRLRRDELTAIDWRFVKNVRNWNWFLMDTTWRFSRPSTDWNFTLENPADKYTFTISP